MTVNMIPYILVDSVILPNKPLSNLEIIDATKKLSLDEFRGIFLRDTLPTKTKLNECGILNLDSFLMMVHFGLCGSKKVRISYFDSYGVQPPSELIVYRKSPIFFK